MPPPSCPAWGCRCLWPPELASCLPLSSSRRLKLEFKPSQGRGDLIARILPPYPTSTPAQYPEVGHSERVACVCVQNRAVETRFTVLCQDKTVHRELNAGNIGGPWASLFYPLVSLEQRQNSQEELGVRGCQRRRFSSYSQSHQPLEAAPTGAILSSHIALINYNPSFSISPP